MSMLIALFVLLDAGMPVSSWIGLGLGAIITILGWLGKDAYSRFNDRLKYQEQYTEEIKEKLEKERLERLSENREIDGKISDLHINILNKLDEIKDKFNEFRK